MVCHEEIKRGSSGCVQPKLPRGFKFKLLLRLLDVFDHIADAFGAFRLFIRHFDAKFLFPRPSPARPCRANPRRDPRINLAFRRPLAPASRPSLFDDDVLLHVWSIGLSAIIMPAFSRLTDAVMRQASNPNKLFTVFLMSLPSK